MKIYVSKVSKEFVEVVYGEFGPCGLCFSRVQRRLRIYKDNEIFEERFVPTGMRLSSAYANLKVGVKEGEELRLMEEDLRRLNLI